MSASIIEELKVAAAAVEKASVPDDLRSVAFTAAFWTAHGGSGSAAPSPTPPLTTGLSPDASGYERIAQKLEVSVDDAEFAFELLDNDLGLRIRPSSLDPTRKEAQRQIIYLVTAGRQAAGIDTETAASVVKDVCKYLGKDDTNFSPVLDTLHGKGLIVGGSGRGKTVRANADGFERAGQILKQLKSPSD